MRWKIGILRRVDRGDKCLSGTAHDRNDHQATSPTNRREGLYCADGFAERQRVSQNQNLPTLSRVCGRLLPIDDLGKPERGDKQQHVQSAQTKSRKCLHPNDFKHVETQVNKGCIKELSKEKSESFKIVSPALWR
jgi:hypothetical protein